LYTINIKQCKWRFYGLGIKKKVVILNFCFIKSEARIILNKKVKSQIKMWRVNILQSISKI